MITLGMPYTSQTYHKIKGYSPTVYKWRDKVFALHFIGNIAMMTQLVFDAADRLPYNNFADGGSPFPPPATP